MFRYLLFFGAAFYLALLIGGEDRGQQRMGLAGAYDAPPAPALPATTLSSEDADRTALQSASASTRAPVDALRILPAPDRPIVQQVSLTTTPDSAEPETPDPMLRTVTADAANVRADASRNAPVIGRVEQGEVVRLVGQVGDWVHIRIEGDGIDGFVHRRLLSSEAPGLTTATLFPATD